MGRADLSKQPNEVAQMFDGVAEHYDRTDTVVTLGLDRWWRRAMVRRLSLRPGDRVADIAAGTAVSTVALEATGAWVVAADFSRGMLEAGARIRDVPRVAADAMQLPFAAASFDAVTISFGLRNIVDPAAALREFARITRPGGQLLVGEFSRPYAAVRLPYKVYTNVVVPALARRVSSNPAAYRYLSESIAAWPNQVGLAGIIGSAGWRDVSVRNLTFGTVALHHAIRAAD